MKIEEAVEVLKRHNEWRRGGDGEMQDPKILGVAIDKAVEVLSKNFGRNSKFDGSNGNGYQPICKNGSLNSRTIKPPRNP